MGSTRLVAVAAIACMGAACKSPSQVVLGFATDLSAPGRLDHITMSVQDDLGDELLHEDWNLPGIRAQTFSLPGSFTIFARDGGEPTVKVVLTGDKDGAGFVTRTALLGLAAEQTLFFRMTLIERCAGMSCGANETCVDGRCRSDKVSVASLRPYATARETTVECDSGSPLVDTGTHEPMATAGSGFCAPDQWCGEATCYRNRARGLLWCTDPSATCAGIDDYEACILAACGAGLDSCYGPGWQRGVFDGACADYATCRTACACEPSCVAACDATLQTSECGACLVHGGVADCRAAAAAACGEPRCRPIPSSTPADLGTGGARRSIPPGTYVIGCDGTDPACPSDAQPAHRVTVGAFDIDELEVSQRRWSQCMAAGGCTAPFSAQYAPSVTPNRPVTNVSWDMASAFCAWAGGRLPSEAEWEIAAHGVVGASAPGTAYPWGDTPLPMSDCSHAVYAGCLPVPTAPHDGGLHPPGASPFGVQDLSGNVEEWVGDWYAADTYMLDAAGGVPSNPMGPMGALPPFPDKVKRGGAYDGDAASVRATTRHSALPKATFDDVGLRCVYLPGG